MNEDGGPETMRKKYFTRNEIISKLTENDVKKVVSEIVEELFLIWYMTYTCIAYFFP